MITPIEPTIEVGKAKIGVGGAGDHVATGGADAANRSRDGLARRESLGGEVDRLRGGRSAPGRIDVEHDGRKARVAPQTIKHPRNLARIQPAANLPRDLNHRDARRKEHFLQVDALHVLGLLFDLSVCPR